MRVALVGTLIALLLAAPGRASAWEPRCAVEEPLGEAAAALLLAGAPLDAASLARAAREAGSDLPVLHAVVLGLDDEARGQAWLAALAARSDAPLACGHARDAGRVLLLASPRGGALALAEGALLSVALAPDFHAPRLVVLDAAGVLHGVPLGADETSAELPADAARPLRVQLVATGPQGPRPVAERLVTDAPLDVAARERLAAAGVRVASAPARDSPASSASSASLVSTVSSATRASSTADVAARLAEARRKAGLPALRPHRLLARAALAHARAVCASGRVAHQLEPGASPEARLAALGVRARLVGEAIGRAVDLDAAWAALFASPSHREALLEPRFTDAGAATALDARGRVCVAVALAGWPRLVPPPRVSRRPPGRAR